MDGNVQEQLMMCLVPCAGISRNPRFHRRLKSSGFVPVSPREMTLWARMQSDPRLMYWTWTRRAWLESSH